MRSLAASACLARRSITRRRRRPACLPRIMKWWLTSMLTTAGSMQAIRLSYPPIPSLLFQMLRSNRTAPAALARLSASARLHRHRPISLFLPLMARMQPSLGLPLSWWASSRTAPSALPGTHPPDRNESRPGCLQPPVLRLLSISASYAPPLFPILRIDNETQALGRHCWRPAGRACFRTRPAIPPRP